MYARCGNGITFQSDNRAEYFHFTKCSLSDFSGTANDWQMRAHCVGGGKFLGEASINGDAEGISSYVCTRLR
jgi:hypothetical protein